MNDTNEVETRTLPVRTVSAGAVDVLTENDAIKSRIFTIRGVQVILAPDLALFYGVPTKRLNEQVIRNGDRFPERFMFRLTSEEVASLRSQIATSNGGAESGMTALRSQFATSKRGGTRYLPYAFTGWRHRSWSSSMRLSTIPSCLSSPRSGRAFRSSS